LLPAARFVYATTSGEEDLMVCKLVVALALSTSFLSVSPAEAGRLYAGVFAPGSDARAAWIGAEWEDFYAKWKDFDKANLRIVDFESYTSGDKRLYAGIFRASTQTRPAWIGKPWNEFHQKWQEIENDGYMMWDIESYKSGNTWLFAGIFRPKAPGFAAWIDRPWDDFLKKWGEFEKAGLRMRDFETKKQGDLRLWSGVFVPGTGGHAAWIGVDWASFDQKWKEWTAQGLRLTDFETYVDGNDRKYAGVYLPGSGGHGLWVGRDWESFLAKWCEFEKSNLRLVDLETYEGSCSESCQNHVVMPDDPGTSWRDGYNYGVTMTKKHCPGLPDTCGTPGADDVVVYQWPVLNADGSEPYVRHSALMYDEKPDFTLPFSSASGVQPGGIWEYSLGSWHHAIDYGGEFDVLAAAAGKVVHVGWDIWSGNTVVVSHDVGGRADAFRTIYMHLKNGPTNDCQKNWDSVAFYEAALAANPNDDLQDAIDDLKEKLGANGCPKTGTRNPTSSYFGTDSQKIVATVGGSVTRGQKLASSGRTGPGGKNGHHLHIFFARKDPTNDQWYFIDPYGIYAHPECYPAQGTMVNTPCVRYTVAWKGQKTQHP
jgi:hypothetical protein